MARLSIVRFALPLAASLLSLNASGQAPKTPQDPSEARVAFVKIDVNDLAAAVTAYAHAFQMQDVGSVHNDAPPLDETTLKFGPSADTARISDTTGIVLVFVPGRAPTHDTPDKTPSAVLTVPSVEATVARAKEAGFTVIRPPKTTQTYSVALLADASGNVIELIHLTR